MRYVKKRAKVLIFPNLVVKKYQIAYIQRTGIADILKVFTNLRYAKRLLGDIRFWFTEIRLPPQSQCQGLVSSGQRAW